MKSMGRRMEKSAGLMVPFVDLPDYNLAELIRHLERIPQMHIDILENMDELNPVALMKRMSSTKPENVSDSDWVRCEVHEFLWTFREMLNSFTAALRRIIGKFPAFDDPKDL